MKCKNNECNNKADMNIEAGFKECTECFSDKLGGYKLVKTK